MPELPTFSRRGPGKGTPREHRKTVVKMEPRSHLFSQTVVGTPLPMLRDTILLEEYAPPVRLTVLTDDDYPVTNHENHHPNVPRIRLDCCHARHAGRRPRLPCRQTPFRIPTGN